MYKPIDKLQHSFLHFNQPLGLHMNPDNRWIKLADQIPWDTFEAKYAELFPSDTGNVAKPLRMALGALIIQTKFQLGGEIYLAVSWYTFVCFILHIHLILHFCVPHLKFLEPK